jgi:hypothetical protein
MTFFTNAFEFNRYSANKIDSTNLAREIHEQFMVNEAQKSALKSLLDEIKSTSGPITISKTAYPELKLKEDIILNASNILELSLEDSKYNIFVYLNKNTQTGEEYPIHQLHVQVLDKNNKPLSETFTYFEP